MLFLLVVVLGCILFICPDSASSSSSTGDELLYYNEYYYNEGIPDEFRMLPVSEIAVIDRAMEMGLERLELEKQKIRMSLAKDSDRTHTTTTTADCDACLVGVAVVDSLLEMNATEEELAKFVKAYCIYFNVPKYYRDVKTVVGRNASRFIPPFD